MVARHRSSWILRAFLASCIAGVVLASPDAAASTRVPRAVSQDLCAEAVTRQEKRHEIPRRLLTAISLVEAGRWDSEAGTGAAWPWTVTAQGKGRFFPTKAAAIAAVKKLQARGITSIDVGCMQVNLHFHPNAFPSLSAAFDPSKNADYAAQFLTALKRDQGSWKRAVQHYHSSTAKKRIPYQKKVYTAWRDTARSDETAERPADASRIRRVSEEIERDHRAKLNDYRRLRRQTAAKNAGKDVAENDSGDDDSTPRFLSSWPPRSASAQIRAQNLARAWAFGGGARNVRP